MRRSEAAAIARALNDIEDFEILMEQIEMAYHNTEGNFDDFYENKLKPVMKQELERREAILENM